jgi:hypothetical protein
LFVIWCLRFGILLSYQIYLHNWFRIYFEVALRAFIPVGRRSAKAFVSENSRAV